MIKAPARGALLIPQEEANVIKLRINAFLNSF